MACSGSFGICVDVGTERCKNVYLVIFLPLGIACLFSALRLKNGLWIATSIFTILLAYSTIRFELEYQPLAMAVIAVLAFLVPGIQLYMNNKERNGDV